MTERSFILKDEMGLHARPAAMLMVRMLHVRSTVEIICGDRRADGMLKNNDRWILILYYI